MQSTSRSNKLKLIYTENKNILLFFIWFLSNAFGICGYYKFYCNFLGDNYIFLSKRRLYVIVLYTSFMMILGIYISIKLIYNHITHARIHNQFIYAISLFCSLVPIPCGFAWIVLLLNNANLPIIIVALIYIALNFPICRKIITFYDKSILLLNQFYTIWIIVTNITLLVSTQLVNWSEGYYRYKILLCACICSIIFGFSLLFKVPILSNITIYIFKLYNIVLIFWFWKFAGFLFLPPILIFVITNLYVTINLSKKR